MDNSGLRPLNPDEEAVVREFVEYMEAVIIPQIVANDFENRERAAKSRNWFVN